MFLPKGNDLWKDLKVFFVDVDKLLLFFKKDEFAGYAHFCFHDREGVIFFEEGDAVGGVEEYQKERKGGAEAVKEILDRARKERDASFTVCRLPSETVAIISELHQFRTRALYKNLSSDFSNISGFVSKAKKEGFTGYMEIHFPEGQEEGLISFQKGKIVYILSEDIQIGLQNKTDVDLEVINKKIVKAAQQAGLHFDVYAPI